MKKSAIQFAITLFFLSTLFAIQQEEVSMKLVNTRTGFIVIEFKHGTPQFHDRFLEAEMKERGISIPSNRRADFDGKDSIYPNDPLFQQAFEEIYVPQTIASSYYQWQP